ncbi:tRNA (N6-threonylcarbamoyladenosine(37)-N6)-methyltransferase TrmO [Rhodobacterales bacterium HKCCE3408]|nr:tRNA (N6-threonylcarbamoyladenosine(37)-N6)-methyltransferase TrmO [Rhodobacterales bacterium HKCCE3408]
MPASSTDAKRPGEVALPFDPADRAEASLTFIGRIRSPWSKGEGPKNVRTAREMGCDAWIELDPAYAAGLTGINVGQAIQLIYWVDRGTRDLIVQTPGHADGPRGVFALRSPVRPNPIALSTVLITSIDGARIGIDATDAWDGTPVLDIKPWIETIDAPPHWRETS